MVEANFADVPEFPGCRGSDRFLGVEPAGIP